MANYVRNVLNSYAPGVFFAPAPNLSVNGALVKIGPAYKYSRGRGVVPSLMTRKWDSRTFRVFEDMNIHYYDANIIKGDFSIKNATFRVSEKTGGKDFVLEIATHDGEKIMLAFETATSRDEWMDVLQLIGSGRWRVLKHLEPLRSLLYLPAEAKFSLVVNNATMKSLLAEDNYPSERLNEILEQYLINLVQKLLRFHAEDTEFFQSVKKRWPTLTITVNRSTDKDISRGYYKTYFTPHGEIAIEAKAAWANVSDLGHDITNTLSIDPTMSYRVAKSIRKHQPHKEIHLQVINTLLQRTGITYDYCLPENLAVLKQSITYNEDHFGEIFLDAYLRAFSDSLRACITQDPYFPQVFNTFFTGNVIIVQQSLHPSTVNAYNQTSFTDDGNVLIRYKDLWTNMHQVGKDIPVLVTKHAPLYLAKISVRKSQSRMDTYLSVLSSMMQVSGIEYDYCMEANLQAMHQAGSQYTDEQFGEIFVDSYLKALTESVTGHIKQDPRFIDAFKQRFTGKRIIIRPATRPDAIKQYHDASFTEEGNLLIEYKYLWTNMNYLGKDIPKLLSQHLIGKEEEE